MRQGTELSIASLDGAPTVTLTDKANSFGGDWGEDGYIYFEVDSGIVRMRPGGQAVERVYTLSQEGRELAAEFPNLLPGGRGILFRIRRMGQTPSDYEIAAMKLPRVHSRRSPAGYTPGTRMTATCWR